MRKRTSEPKRKKAEVESEEEVPKAKPYVSHQIYLNIKKLENPFYRADIEFRGVDHSAESYEGRVFMNNPDANRNTGKTSTNGYVGSFHIFGHGGCYGDVGHCEIRKDRRQYDYRPPHQLTPLYKRLIVTDDLRRLGKNTDKFTVTIVPVLAGGSTMKDVEDIVKVDEISLVTYD
jgi:hypothetical protein